VQAIQQVFAHKQVLRELRLRDAMLIRLAHAKRSSRARVTPEVVQQRLLPLKGRVLLRGQCACAGAASAKSSTVAGLPGPNG
jgi:hypothetical protein